MSWKTLFPSATPKAVSKPPVAKDNAFRIVRGDALSVLKRIPDGSISCCVTSPPYWGLRDYKLEPIVWGGKAGCEHEWGDDLGVRAMTHQDRLGNVIDPRSGRPAGGKVHGQSGGFKVSQGSFCSLCGAWRGSLGLEPTPELYAQHLVEIFREVRRVLKSRGVFFLNLGDSYAANRSYQVPSTKGGPKHSPAQGGQSNNSVPDGLKPKDLIGIPWRVAFALQADGWYLRSDIIWAKPNCMPESVKDRPTRSHEYVFLLTKSAKYYWDGEAIKESSVSGHSSGNGFKRDARLTHRNEDGSHESDKEWVEKPTRNSRSVWCITTQPCKEAHFATMPVKLAEKCILAGCPEGRLVLDPFAGAGTTGLACLKHGRRFLGIELNPEYIEIANVRREKMSSLNK